MREIVYSLAAFATVLGSASWKFGSIARGSYALSTIHALSMLILTSYVIFVDCGWDSDPVSAHCNFDSAGNNELQQRMLMWSIGYFIVDSVVVLSLVPDYEAAFHHVTIVIGQIAAIMTGTCGYALSWFLFLAELSAPFLNCFLSGLTIEGTSIDFAVRAIFAIVFIISRLVICPFMTYKFVFGCDEAPLTPRLVCLCVMGISIVWGKRVIAATVIALKGLFNEDSRKMKK